MPVVNAARLLRDALDRQRCRTDGIADHCILLCAGWPQLAKAVKALEERERCQLKKAARLLREARLAQARRHCLERVSWLY